MIDMMIKASNNAGLDDATLFEYLEESVKIQKSVLKKVLLLPPDMTRMHSGAGKITAMYYRLLKDTCDVDIMPALGTHEAMSARECYEFFGDEIPMERIRAHHWRKDVERIGVIPEEFIEEVSEGFIKKSIAVEINKRLLDPSYDLIISIGQVVPHEVAGMANYSKNIFVGCGGCEMINESHMLGAFYGMERIMGRDRTPVRRVFDYAEEHFIKEIPLMYVLTVTTNNACGLHLHGLFIGRDRRIFEEAVKLSQEKNLIFLEKPLKKVVVFLDEREFKSTWLGNKAIYRTRMAIEDNGELIILAPGVRKFGEDDANDVLIRKYGYVGKRNVLDLCSKNDDLKYNLSVAAHLIHGSSDDRFTITYAVEKITREEIEEVNFRYLDIGEALQRYNPNILQDGYNTLEDGEEIFFIRNPAIGLWVCKSLF